MIGSNSELPNPTKKSKFAFSCITTKAHKISENYVVDDPV